MSWEFRDEGKFYVDPSAAAREEVKAKLLGVTEHLDEAIKETRERQEKHLREGARVAKFFLVAAIALFVSAALNLGMLIWKLFE